MNPSVALLMVLALLIGCGLMWWLIVETEGVYLGRRVVIALYDLYAGRYDAIKAFDPMQESLHLAQPIMARLHPETRPLVLDVATGTGRLPLALCADERFEGHIIALDLSQRMLRRARAKIDAADCALSVDWLWHSAECLPFDDAAFDLVTCLEALEFMPDPDAALSELCRVLRPGGCLLVTQRIHQPWMPDRTWSETRYRDALHARNMHAIRFELWQYDYKKVWARKEGASVFIGVRPLHDVLREDRMSSV